MEKITHHTLCVEKVRITENNHVRVQGIHKLLHHAQIIVDWLATGAPPPL